MGDEGFGVMDLLQKLFKEREQTGGAKGAVSDQEMDIFEGAQTGAQNAGFMQGLQELTTLH